VESSVASVSPSASPATSPSDSQTVVVVPPPSGLGPAPSTPPDGQAPEIRIPYQTYQANQPIDVSLVSAMSGLSLAWVVPGLTLMVPGLLIVLVVIAQAAGGLIWLPIIKRRIAALSARERAGR
jgi:hypothetical protein